MLSIYLCTPVGACWIGVVGYEEKCEEDDSLLPSIVCVITGV